MKTCVHDELLLVVFRGWVSALFARGFHLGSLLFRDLSFSSGFLGFFLRRFLHFF